MQSAIDNIVMSIVLMVDFLFYIWFRYIPRYTFSWLVQPMWLVLSMYNLLFSSFNLESYFCESNMNLLFYIEFLHRAADLTLVPSAAIARDLEEARVTAGEHKPSLSNIDMIKHSSYTWLCVN